MSDKLPQKEAGLFKKIVVSSPRVWSPVITVEYWWMIVVVLIDSYGHCRIAVCSFFAVCVFCSVCVRV